MKLLLAGRIIISFTIKEPQARPKTQKAFSTSVVCENCQNETLSRAQDDYEYLHVMPIFVEFCFIVLFPFNFSRFSGLKLYVNQWKKK